MTEIIASTVIGGLSLLGVIITTLAGSRHIQQQIEINQAVANTKIEELTREVREHNEEHNEFARHMPVVDEQIKVINHRIQDLEEKIS
jgi:peptidoglycan hydrolase CwlO-like protein